jgi:hypothetical protein
VTVPEPAGNCPAPASHASRRKVSPCSLTIREADDDLNNHLPPGVAAMAEAERRTSDATADPDADKRPTRRTAKGFRHDYQRHPATRLWHHSPCYVMLHPQRHERISSMKRLTGQIRIFGRQRDHGGV